ncbi:hypothetical protein ACFL26_01485 [Patescibacteria group bacterium]
MKLDDSVLETIHHEYEQLTEEQLGQLGIVLGAYRSFRGNRRKHIGYVSMPITSGKRLYEVLSHHGVTSLQELLDLPKGGDLLYEEVIRPNIDDGIGLADHLGATRDLLFIAPSVFEAKRWRWTQEAYMSLWYRVIAEMAGSHYLMDGWEYSTGGVKEVMLSLIMQWRGIRPRMLDCAVHGWRLQDFMVGKSREDQLAELEEMQKIRIYDERSAVLAIDDILESVVVAVEDLRERGMDYEPLLGLAATIKSTPSFTPYDIAEDLEREGLLIRPGDRFDAAADRLDDLLIEDYVQGILEPE